MDCEPRKGQKLCERGECKTCLSRRFASVENSKYMVEGQEKLLSVSKHSKERADFRCPKCSHSFSAMLYNITEGYFCPFCAKNKLCDAKDCKKCFERSFASHEKAEFWSTDKNSQTPREAFKISGKKFWFECGKCKHSFQVMLSNVVAGCFCPYCPRRKLCDDEDCEMCFKNSFASRERAKCWCYEKNKVRPRDVSLYSHKKYWFNCDKCEHSFESVLSSIKTDKTCPFCSNKRLCDSEDCKQCFQKSFASHKYSGQWLREKNKKKPREVFLGAGKKFWFKCELCTHTFELTPNDITSPVGCFCPFCSGVRICFEGDCEMCFKKSFSSHEKAKYWNEEKNGVTPREVFRGTQKKYSFVCEKKHIFASALSSISRGSWCPQCKNKTESKLLKFLEEKFEDVAYQFKVSWCKNPETDKHLPFDFCVSKTIIELDGRQHYEQVSNWRTPEEQQKKDRYKEECAMKNGYSVLRILQEDVWEDRIDWKKLLLEHIKNYEKPTTRRLWKD